MKVSELIKLLESHVEKFGNGCVSFDYDTKEGTHPNRVIRLDLELLWRHELMYSEEMPPAGINFRLIKHSRTV